MLAKDQRGASTMNPFFPCILLRMYPIPGGGRKAAARSPEQGRFSSCRRDVAGDAGADSYDMASVLLSCPYDTWKQTFGEPQDIQKYRGVEPDPHVEGWEQPCSDGVVRCVGHFVDDPHDGKWVVLMRVCLF